ncbi:hypothetical protein [Xylophilus ampelinus]|uniref:Uncharacterized protein n=1 Tax=Xylophilus ampelinus TaxID=54067 RepID=A0A318SBX1_9BURK|nr:hypothetical protein [Xylophilus ampelinus]MCS4511780.1 hypothetical protein [Xylophilus ampelinus]PYE73424.1 hypothetical protein DFQ15_13411 [Xylophilus ampelinus]
MSQNIAVALIVLGAAAWAVWFWMPTRGRLALADVLAQGARRIGLRARGAERIAAAVGNAPGCGSCESCGGCVSPGMADKAVARKAASEGEKPVTVVRRS